MRFLNIEYDVQAPDPYVIEKTILKKNEKGGLHLTRLHNQMEQKRNPTDMRLFITSRSIETVRSVANQSSLSAKEVVHRAVVTAERELGGTSGRKRKISTNGPPAKPPNPRNRRLNPFFSSPEVPSSHHQC